MTQLGADTVGMQNAFQHAGGAGAVDDVEVVPEADVAARICVIRRFAPDAVHRPSVGVEIEGDATAAC